MSQVISTKTAEHYVWGGRCDGWHLLGCDELSVIQEQMPPGTSEVVHFHGRSRQFFYVISGVLSILLDGFRHTLTREEGLEIPPGAAHHVFNDSESEVRFIVISVPPSRGDRFEI